MNKKVQSYILIDLLLQKAEKKIFCHPSDNAFDNKRAVFSSPLMAHPQMW
jgi:hypothetical protein